LSAASKLSASVILWLDGSNADPLLFDATWGGIVSADGIADPNADFGNGWYIYRINTYTSTSFSKNINDSLSVVKLHSIFDFFFT
jgi:hypothetical protein